MKKKKILILSVFLFIVLSILLSFLFSKEENIKPRGRIEYFNSENGDYLYTVEVYNESDKLKHIMRKIDLKENKSIWESKMDTTYHSNHYLLKEKSPIFFDKENVYYFVNTVHKNIYLIGFNKLTGERILNFDLNKDCDFKMHRKMLYLPYINFSDKIIIFYWSKKDKNSDQLLSFTKINKTNLKISHYSIPVKGLYLQSFQGKVNKSNNYFVFQNHGKSYIFNKQDLSEYSLIKNSRGIGLLHDNRYFYSDYNNNFIRKNLNTEKEKILFNYKLIRNPLLRMYFKDNLIVYGNYKKNNKLINLFRCYDFNGNLKWEYKHSENMSFGFLFAQKQVKSITDKALYFKIENKYLPVLLSGDRVKSSFDKKLIMLNLNTGKTLWEKSFKNIKSTSFLPFDFFKVNKFYYIFYKNGLIQVNPRNGKLLKRISFKIKEKNKIKNIIGRYNLKRSNFVKDYLIVAFKDSILKVNLISNEYEFYGEKDIEKNIIVNVKKENINLK